MDDDSEFQSQSFQLLGEDGNKFPPSFRSFALPKIDIDEHLQVHLRFDSLVDTEALLGIQGQDNSWIEDFSPGTTAIEFSSSAAESCSISRHNNVWSEATSSESVEMLLKSVAEEEMTGKQTSIMEKDELSESRGTKDQMDASFGQGDDHKSGVGDIGQNVSALPLDKCVENLSVVDKGATIVQPQVEDAVARQTSDSITCTSTQDDPSSAFSNPDLGPRKFNIQTLTDNVVEEHIEISMSKRSDLLSNDGQKETSHVTGRDEVTEQYLEVPEAMSGLSTGKSYLVEPIMDSMMLMGEGCNRSGYSENPDGLLEAIAYPIKDLSKEIEASDRSSTQSVGVSKLSNNMCSLTKEEDKSMERQSVEIGSKTLPILPPASEGSKDVCYKQQNYCSNVDYFHVELPTQNAKINDDHGGKQLDSLMGVTKGKQYPECNPTENSRSDIGNTSEMMLEVHAAVYTNSGTHMNKVEDEVCSEAYISRLKSQNPESMVIEKSTEVKVAEKLEVEICASDAKSNESHSSTYISVAGIRITSPIPKNMVGQEDLLPSTLPGTTDANNNDIVSIGKAEDTSTGRQNTDTVSVIADTSTTGQEDLLPSTLPGTTDVNNNDIVSIGKAEDTSTGRQNTDTVSVIADTSTTAKDLAQDAMVTAHTLADVDSTALKKHTIMQQSYTDTSSVVDGILEHKGEDLNVQLRSVPVTVTDPLVANESPLKGEIQVESGAKVASLDHQSADASALEQKEEAISSSPASELVHSHENEITIPGNVSIPHPEGKKFTQVSSEPVPEPAIGYHDSMTEPRPIMDGKSSSYMDTSVHSPCQTEPHSSADKPPSHESTNWVEGVLVVNDSVLNGKDTSDFPAVISQENKEKAQSSDGAETCFIDASTFNLSKSNAESQLLEAGSGNLNSLELNCGSPTIISCSEHPQDQEGSRVLSEQAATISNDVPFISSGTEVNGDEVRLSANEVKESAALEDDKGFTFEVGSLTDLSGKNTGNEWKPFPSMQSPELPKMSKEKPHGRRTEPKERKQGLRRKTPNTDKTSKVAVSSNESPSMPQGKPSKETPILKTPIDRDSSSCSVSSTYSATVNEDMQLEESRQHTCIEKSKMKTSPSPIVQTSSLPDLNSSVVATPLLYQPFTDLQQVQLRAQIFVYGSLIQGIPPGDACMVSAFAETDGGRSSWEGLWRLSVERYQAMKSPFVNSESPHPHSAVRVSEQVTRCNSLQSKFFNTPTSQTSGKVVPPSSQNSTPPLPSPVWSISTHDGLNTNIIRGMHLDFNQALSPLHSYYSSQTRHFANSSTLWPSQVLRIEPPRGVSVQGSTLAAATQYSTVPVVETVQVASMRDSTTPRAPNIQLVTPGALLPTPSPVSVTAPSVVKIETQGKTATPGPNKNASTIQKRRKRKKAGEPKELGSTIPLSHSTTEPSATIVTKTATPASAGLGASSGTKDACANLLSTTTDIFPAHCQVIGSNSTEQRVIFSEETSSRIEQAKMQAEEAAVLAAASVRHSQSIWSQLAALRDSGLVSEVEVKLASAAVAAAAAASVAKAAAAAAKIASDAAVQAKMMADEALNLARTGTLTQSPDSSTSVMARLTPDSILKGKDKVDRSPSVISAAREAAMRRVEAASASTKRAENIDAIIKAAELAAEAVSQAGFIIAMGDPLPFKLSELVESGPEGFWKAKRAVSEKLNTNDFPVTKDMGLNHNEHHSELVRQSNVQALNKKDIQQTAIEGRLSKNEQSVTLAGNYQGGSGNDVSVQNNRQQRDNLSSNLKESDIQKGSFVEVVTDDDGLRGAWYSACVLDVKDKKAYVCYDNLLNDKGSGQLKEWVPLEGEVNIAPRIRIAHPVTVLKHEIKKKRRREAVGNYVWEVGDRVDAWMRDGWWEGIVTEKNQGVETKLNVYFPAGGDSSVVQAWNLRPSLIWKDDQWAEWSRARDNTLQPYEGDTPPEKRQKLNRPEAHLDAEVDSRGITKFLRETPLEDSRKPEEPRPLNLSAKDNFFSVGRNVREEGVSDANKLRRTGLQKEGSRVVFGVPKPGKKKKFMEVSKHYVSDSKTDKTTEMKDSLKFAKYLMPQQSRLWKNSSKVDPKGKKAGESNKPRGLKTLKSQTIQTRSTTEKDTSSISTTSVSIGENKGRSGLPNSRDGIGNKCNLEKNHMEVLSFPSSLGTTSSLPDSYVQSLPRGPAAKKKVASTAQAESKIKGRSSSKVDKPNGSEDKGFENSVKALPDSIEPRRSIRRIQPTSRLLEGLQSSLIISRIPSFSHDKGARNRGSSSSRGNTHG